MGMGRLGCGQVFAQVVEIEEKACPCAKVALPLPLYPLRPVGHTLQLRVQGPARAGSHLRESEPGLVELCRH